MIAADNIESVLGLVKQLFHQYIHLFVLLITRVKNMAGPRRKPFFRDGLKRLILRLPDRCKALLHIRLKLRKVCDLQADRIQLIPEQLFRRMNTPVI